MPAYSSFPEKVLILIAIIIALSMCEFWVLLYLFPILTATVQNSITLILHEDTSSQRLGDRFKGHTSGKRRSLDLNPVWPDS